MSVAPRFDTRMRRPPVRIGLASARILQDGLTDFNNQPLGAGGYGQKLIGNSSVPIRLRIQQKAGPNSPAAIAAAKPFIRTRRKRGFPPVIIDVERTGQ